MKNDIDLMARTAYGEARGDGPEGMRAVMHVIMNRAHDGVAWNGRSVVEAIFKDRQFSAWNEGDPNRAIMLAVTTANPVFAEARRIAAAVHSGDLPDTTGGATHYHTVSIAPVWADASKVTAVIGGHIFYGGIA